MPLILFPPEFMAQSIEYRKEILQAKGAERTGAQAETLRLEEVASKEKLRLEEVALAERIRQDEVNKAAAESQRQFMMQLLDRVLNGRKSD